MSWVWRYDDADGAEIGRSESFDNRGDAESWIGEAHPGLAADGIARVQLLDGDTEVGAALPLRV